MWLVMPWFYKKFVEIDDTRSREASEEYLETEDVKLGKVLGKKMAKMVQNSEVEKRGMWMKFAAGLLSWIRARK